MAQQPRRYEETKEQLAGVSLDEAIARSVGLVDELKEMHQPLASLVLFSGGNDSTVLAHLMRPLVEAAVHINTGIGIEETRQFVRDTCAGWELPLVEEHPPPGATYDELVLKLGFPGPGGHQLMYSRLKERGLRAVRRRYVTNGRTERVLFLTGLRVFESARRMRNAEPWQREGSVVWVNPIGHWTNDHMRDYRARFPDLPRNPVNSALGMSGECLCGCFAKPDELAMVAMHYPETAARIRDLERRAREAGVHCVWGTRPPGRRKKASDKVSALCAKCVVTEEEHQADVDDMVAAMRAIQIPRQRTESVLYA